MSTEQPDPRKYAVLYVDDEEQALKYFARGLGKDFPILTAPSVAQAMIILEQEAANIGVVITDQRMPGKTGVQLLTDVRSRWPAIVRVLITAYTEIDSAVAAVNAGSVYKYLTKPADFPTLRQTLLEALAVHRETLYRDTLEKTLRELEAQREATQVAEGQREQLQQQLIAASREAGRAEVATGILHNVGNVLNSMNVSAGVARNALTQSRVGNLSKGLSMLTEHSDDLAGFLASDERGQRLPTYLIKLAAVLVEEQTIIGEAIDSLARNIDHIANVVQLQQTHAKQIILREPLKPDSIMEDAIRVNQSSIEKHGVQLVREYAELPIILIDQHRVLQILINLVNNAIRAVSEMATSSKRVIVRIQEIQSEGSPKIVFQIVDEGAGIAPNNLTRIFTYGFTTRKDGHGFGLHSAANTAREMGGSLTATSNGPDMGASFTLELPMTCHDDAAPRQADVCEKVES